VTLNPQVFRVVQFNPEYLWDYEAFIRATGLRGTLTVNGNLFYNDIRNAQRAFGSLVPTPTGPVGLEGWRTLPGRTATAPRFRPALE